MTHPNPLEPSAPMHKTFDPVGLFEKYGVLIFLIVLVIFFTLYNPLFLSARNVKNILTEVSIYGIIGIGMTYVILTGGIDLAVGSLLAFGAISGAWAMRAIGGDVYLGWLLAMCVACLIGAAAGFVHGKLITRLRIPAFIVTLGGLTIWRGGALIVNNGASISGFDAAFRWWGRGEVLGVPVPVVVLALVTLTGYVALRYTRYGRQVYAVGGNPEAARLSGLSVRSVVLSVYVITGFLAGLAGFLLAARLGSAESVAGQGYELRIIASVIIGGTSLFGGLGGVGGTIIGALLIGVLINGLVIMNVSAYWQQVIIGVIIVLAVGFDTYAKSRAGMRR